MGFLTTITIHNDALHSFEKNPEKFGQSILSGIHRAQFEHREVTVGLNGYGNYIHVQPSRHADDNTLYLHTGNGVNCIDHYDKDFQNLMISNPKLAKDWIKRAKQIIKSSEVRLKDYHRTAKEKS